MPKTQARSKGKFIQERSEPKTQRGLKLTDTCYRGLQLLAEHYNARARAEFLERYVRAECDRLGISLEPVAESAEGEQEAA